MFSLRLRLQRLMLILLPATMALLLTVAMLLAQRRFGLGGFMPMLPLMAIYYWSIYAPRRMPYGVAFVIGLIYDSLLGLPLGVTSLLFMLFKYLLQSQHRVLAKDPFAFIWLRLALLLAVVLGGQWLAVMVYFNNRPPVDILFVQYMLTVLLYPVLHAFFQRIDQLTQRRVILALHQG